MATLTIKYPTGRVEVSQLKDDMPEGMRRLPIGDYTVTIAPDANCPMQPAWRVSSEGYGFPKSFGTRINLMGDCNVMVALMNNIEIELLNLGIGIVLEES